MLSSQHIRNQECPQGAGYKGKNMTAQCVKTGCHIYLTEYGEYAYGDAHEYGGMMMFRIAGFDLQPINNNEVLHYVVHTIGQWWKDDPYGTLIASRMYVTDFGYDGIPIEEAFTNVGRD